MKTIKMNGVTVSVKPMQTGVVVKISGRKRGIWFGNPIIQNGPNVRNDTATMRVITKR